jgi:L-amino acid N-acyltransferase YncA
MKALIYIALILFYGAVVHASDQKPSKEMQKILDLRFSQPSELGTGGLKKLHFQDLEEISKLATFEKYRPEDVGVVIGYAYAGKWNVRSAYRHTVETTVYLSNSTLSKGWGTRLYQALFDTLRDKSIHTIVGGITLPNPASIALHEKFGMKKVAHFSEVGYKFGKWLDVGYWQMELKS